VSSTVFRKTDLNRFSKTYPFLRREPKTGYVSDTSIVLESATVDFEGNDEVVYTFQNPYTSAPVVVATSLNDSFNVFIKAVSLSSVTIGASVANNFSASVFVVLNA